MARNDEKRGQTKKDQPPRKGESLVAVDSPDDAELYETGDAADFAADRPSRPSAREKRRNT